MISFCKNEFYTEYRTLKIRILFLITEDWYFWSHRLSIARAVRDRGFDVLIATRVHKHEKRILDEGFKLIPIKMVRRSKNILKELSTIIEIIRIYQREKPDIVHHVTLKPVLYGSWAAIITRVPHIINAFAGLGSIFTNKGSKWAIYKFIVCLAYRSVFFLKKTVALFQNPDDLALFVNAGITTGDRAHLIKGAGVDINLFKCLSEHDSVPIVMLASRMIWNKGVGVLIDSARQLRKKGVKCRIVLVGVPDPENLTSISEDILRDWNSEGIIEWWGYQDNMPDVLSRSHIVVLPTTYGEGIPKILIEAASCGRPIVATNVSGCREIVRHNENGFLVPPNDSIALTNAIETLIKSPGLRRKFGSRGREIVISGFSEEIVVEQTVGLYCRLLS